MGVSDSAPAARPIPVDVALPPTQEGGVPRFDATNQDSLREGVEYLRSHGYAVFSNVMDAEQVEEAHDKLWQWLEAQGPRRNDPTTWNSFPGDPTTGIQFGNGLGQSDLLWHCRGAPLVHQVFSAVWETEDLIVSFDGANVFRPWRLQKHFFPEAKRSWRTRGGWWHVDQNPLNKPGLEAVQGFVSLTRQDRHTGGLAILPCADYQQRFKSIPRTNSGDFIRIASAHVKTMLDEAQSVPTFVPCEAGDLVLWDGRVVHCNTPALDESANPEEQALIDSDTAPGDGIEWPLLRALAYVCMTPRSKADVETLERRRLAVENGAQTNHWPHEMRRTFPGEGGRSIESLNEFQQRLV